MHNRTNKEHRMEKYYRTLVRVTSISDDSFSVVIPGWSVNTEITINKSDVPDYIQSDLVDGKRMHALVNIGVDTVEEIKFLEWAQE